MNLRLTVWCLVVASWVSFVQAGDWPNWRGPHGNGTGDGEGYAIQWSNSSNIAWETALPGKAGSTPIVVGDHIFLTAGIDGKNALQCLSRGGKSKWTVTFGEEREGKHRKGSGSNPSPVSDGKLVYVYYKNGDFAAVDFEGKVQWQRNLQKDYGEDTLWWDLGTSPVLTSQHVVVACVQSGPSYLAAFDRQTGETVWKVNRDTGAPEEAAQTYATPVVTHHKGQEQLIVLGADQVTCHEAATGKQLWHLAGMNPDQEKYFRSISSPVVTGDIVIAPYSRGKTITAIRMGGSGEISKTHVLWHKPGPSADVPTPVAADGKVYVCTDKGTVACLEAESGDELWSLELEKNRNAYSA
ncbi:MAG: PQQ-binding-like beta-propeller repeat protein, partial [Planctomycetaceae bacterium]|nr:PQQ-binding-like beta-propeller repeat protein [Planctomycetaceae bacterium]